MFPNELGFVKQINTPRGKPKEQKTQTNNGLIRKLSIDLEIKSMVHTKVMIFVHLINLLFTHIIIIIII